MASDHINMVHKIVEKSPREKITAEVKAIADTAMGRTTNDLYPSLQLQELKAITALLKELLIETKLNGR